MKERVEQNSFRAWVLAARPKTLAGAAVPVIMALALAYADGDGHLEWLPAALCLLFAFLMQIDANFINDYFDFKKGTDDEARLGPRRACAQGWVTDGAMRLAVALASGLACMVGFPLVFFGGWPMVLVGVFCLVFCFLYTTHLSYMGLGDLLVLAFFGVVPVCATYYLQRHELSASVICASLACGLVVDTLLVVNNYRDRDNDRRVGKITLVVRLGETASEWLYVALGVVAFLLGLAFLAQGRVFTFLLPAVYLWLHLRTARKLCRLKQGKALNLILGQNARNMFLYGLLFSAGVLLDAWVYGGVHP